MKKLLTALVVFAAAASIAAAAQECVDCHQKITPGIVKEWRLSKHSQNEIACAACHGSGHSKMEDAANAEIPTPDTCNMCHKNKVTQFKAGKHAKAWTSMMVMPTTHWQPMMHIEGLKGCGGCHKIGLKNEEETRKLKAGGGYGMASCDACHTRHKFSVKEAREPQACQTCHMGIDHPQWEMYSSSKHGVRHLLKQTGKLPEDTAAPTCQSCHLPEGTHTNRTAWGFLALRLPMPEDKEWAQDRATILQGLGVLDPRGKPTPRLNAITSIDMVRLTEEDFQNERAKMLKQCVNCHSEKFAKGELAKGDRLIRDVDGLMAKGIKVVADLYRDGVIKKSKDYPSAFPDVLTFHDAPTVVEQKLFLMFLEHRMRGFQGAFHMNPDYSLWYGWSAMKRDLTEIEELAAQMRRNAGKK
jgi:hydroxylamine dehydrogenase